MIKKLNKILSKKDKKLLFLLIIFSVFVSAIEVIGVSLIMPFISISLDFELIQSNKFLLYFYDFFYFKEKLDFVIAFGLVVVFFYITRCIVNVFYTYSIVSFTQGRYRFIVNSLFKNYMRMPYDKFVKINSSTLTKTIITEAGQLSTLISSLLLMMSETLVAVSIYTLLIFIDFKITLLLTCFLIINAMLMLMLISRRIKKYGVDRESIQKKFYETINKSMGNFKIIKLQLNDKPVMDEFFYSSQKYAKINVIAQTLLQTPKFILEAIGFSLIIIIVLLMISKGENNISNILGTLSVYVLALYRLMPSVNKMLSSYNNILFSNRALDIIYKDFMNTGEILDNQSIVFNKDIIIKNIKFEFEKNKPILQNINFNIKKGSKVAFIGESGSGKSTLVDIIIGLYRPIYGSVEVDGVKLSESNIKHWRGKVGYIPQSIYLLDGTVGDNVAFNHEYNRNKIIKCLKQAKIYDFLNSKNGLSTMVGEGGVMLSGGQKQRIAIARALYTDPEILVLDEATSALDSNTEREIMDEIYSIGENRTMIIIAHRVATLDKCDVIYTIKNGNIVKN